MLELYNAKLDKDNLNVIEGLFETGQLATGTYENILKEKVRKELLCDNISIVNNYSFSIYLALKVIGVGPGDNVICKSFSCLNSTSPILTLNANIVWVDLELDSTDVSLDDLEEKFKLFKPKVFLNYYIAGYVDQVHEINELCKKYNVKLIQDSNALLYSFVGNDSICKYSDFTVYSLYPNRLVNSIDGGILICKEKSDTLKVDRLKRLGIPNSGFRDSIGEIDINCDLFEFGINAMNSNVSNAIAVNSIEKSKGKLLKLERHVKSLTSILNKSESKRLSLVRHKYFDDMKYCWTLLILVSDKRKFISIAKEKGIAVSGMHINNHFYSCFPAGLNLTNTNSFYERVLAIPCGWWLSELEVEYIANSIVEISNILGNENV